MGANSSKMAVVTGASRGIGRAVALAFAQEGYVVWALARTTTSLEGLAAEPAAGGRVRPLAVDLADRTAVQKAIDTLAAEPAPFVLANNAGIAISAPLAKTRLDDHDRLMAVNVTAPFLLCQAFAPRMVAAGTGRIINIASTAALKGFKYTASYCASKHALLGLTRALAVELAPKQVTVNAVCPGWTDTDLLDKSAELISQKTGRTKDEAKQTLAQRNPMGRLIQPEDVARMCLYLASPAADAVTGATFTIDGGELA